MKGWLIDIYPDYGTNSIVYWVRTRTGVERVVDRAFLPRIFVHSTPELMDDLEKALPVLDAVKSTERVMKRTWLGEDEREVLQVTIGDYSKVEQVAHTIDNRGRYRDYALFNVDLRFSQRYLMEKGIFPMGLMEFRPKPRMIDDPFEIDYELPPLRGTELKLRTENKRGIPTFDDRILSARVGERTIDGGEERVLKGISEELKRQDPDVLFTEDGDAFALPYLYQRAQLLKLPLQLGRDADSQKPDRPGMSYFTYGQIKYKPPSHKLKGRIHIDRSSSFMYTESGLGGLIDLSRISGMPVQELSRLSPGTAINMMEINQAMKDGCVIMWKKNLPEKFKTAEELVIADRGGFIYEPVTGIHDHVLEVDFTSLYPNIMVRFNISPETVMCPCCPEPSRKVPVLGYRICDKHVGLIPRVLKPVVERRTRLKRLVRAGVGDTKVYKERVNILKWLLVTCLDPETEMPFRRRGRFGVAPIGDIVDRCAGGRRSEVDVTDAGLEAFGVDGRMDPAIKRVDAVFKFPAPKRMIELDLGKSVLTLTPDHPCYVLRGRVLELKAAGQLMRGDRLPTLLPLYSDEGRRGDCVSSAKIRGIRKKAPSSDRVYCLGVREPLHGFALSNGVLTHNCFGYTGYRNARFGRIECHEAINAYGRELFLQTSEMAEAHGFEVLHGIVDSLWLKGRGDPEKFCEHVSGHIGIPLEPEGIYKWVVFLPCRSHDIGALNRYYGLFEDGEFKLRGIELRRHDTTGVVRDMQNDLLSHFSRAADSQQFIELLPSALDVVERYIDDLRSGTVPFDKLLLTRNVTQKLDEYRQFNDNVAALAQLDAGGFDVNPGEAVRYMICDCRSKDPKRRVKVDSFIDGSEEYDADAYVDLLLRGVEGMLLPFGYDKEKLSTIFGAKNPRD